MRLFFIFLIILFFPFFGKSAHIVGGEMYYDYLGNNQYRLYVAVYRDCNTTTGAPFDPTLHLGIFNQNGTRIQNATIDFPGSQNIPVVFNNPCVTPPNNICTERALYTTVLTLPPITGGYTIAYQRCCRTPEVTNIVTPDDVGMTVSCQIPGSEQNRYINSSPRFNGYPPLLLCNNEDLIFDHSATDPDGDQLHYSFYLPDVGGSPTPTGAMPTIIPPPPYGTISWLNGFTTVNPLGPGATISIDPNTGLLTASPNLTGTFVVGIQVQEIRNGVVINATKRDFLFRVFNCQVDLQAILPSSNADLPTFVDYCQGLNVQFVNNSYGGTNYEWNFGDPTTTNDLSTVFAPSYTYPGPGQYQVQLVVNPGWACTDTTYMDVIVNNPIQVSFPAQDPQCILNNSFDFSAVSDGPPGTQFTWNFGVAAAPSSTGQSVNNVVFSQGGEFPVTVTATNNLCVAEYTSNVTVFHMPTAEIILPDDYECNGLDIQFQSNLENANNFVWNFGTPSNQTNIANPLINYPTSGTYSISLTASNSPLCTTTDTKQIQVYEDVVLDFTPSSDSLCIEGNSFDFIGTGTGPVGTTFEYSFGGGANPSSSTNLEVFDVEFSSTGTVPVTLVGKFQQCRDSVTKYVYLYSLPTINFGLDASLQCVPFPAQFRDSSWAETPISYFWEFGDGSNSTIQNPSHTYTQIGNYPVTLTIRTDRGCVDTLTLTKEDLVNVRPTPTANFSVDKEITDICDSEIQFKDLSLGANQWYYQFGLGEGVSAIQHPKYVYTESGNYQATQIVTNEWGCKDTAQQQIQINPFTIFAPNAFTPDGNEFNNVFKLITYLYPREWDLRIFDRWGQLIFWTNDPEDFWDGTLPNGQKAQDDTYTWILRYEDCGPIYEAKELSGHITLLK